MLDEHNKDIAKGVRIQFGLNWHEDLAIDPHRLDEEWLNQPALLMKYSELCAQSIHDYDDAQHACELTKAQTAHDARIDPDSFEIGKPTESAIKEAVALDEECKVATAKMHRAKHITALLQSATRALEQRKCALENLVRLHGQGYYSEPSAKAATRDGVRETVHDATHERLKARRSRRTKKATTQEGKGDE